MMAHMIKPMMNEDDKQYRPKKLTIEDIKSGCITLYGEDKKEIRLCVAQEELRQGIETIQQYPHAVTFYGSARIKEDNFYYKKAQNIAYRISKELGDTVISGGGGGVMEAANRGAYEAGGKSIGVTIKLPHEQQTNKYLTDIIPFYFFFTRKVVMSYTSEAYLFFPGGFGTYNELFEMITLKQTKKIGDIPIILVGSEYWKPMDEIVNKLFIEKYKTVEKRELPFYFITDDEDEILKIIRENKATPDN
jgi:hypothetical protein